MKKSFFFLIIFLMLLPYGIQVHAESQNQYLYDSAHLLTAKEASELQSLSSKLGNDRNTAFIVMTANGTDGKDIVQYVEDFYDEHSANFDKQHGNVAILAIDLKERDVYLAGFKKAEQYLDSGRLDQIRDKITPDLSAGNYFEAFSAFIQTSYDYMGYEPGYESGYEPGYEPGINPENILFQWWFQVIVSIIVAGGIVTLMVYRSGGRVTVNAKTYINSHQSKVLNRYDNFVRQTVTRQKIPSNNTKSGGGGGFTSGGTSHSGSGGKF